MDANLLDNFLAFAAPFVWTRLMLHLDSFKFFGSTLIILKVMLKESLIFFAALTVILIGFFQGLTGLDHTDTAVTETKVIVTSMVVSLVELVGRSDWTAS